MQEIFPTEWEDRPWPGCWGQDCWLGSWLRWPCFYLVGIQWGEGRYTALTWAGILLADLSQWHQEGEDGWLMMVEKSNMGCFVGYWWVWTKTLFWLEGCLLCSLLNASLWQLRPDLLYCLWSLCPVAFILELRGEPGDPGRLKHSTMPSIVCRGVWMDSEGGHWGVK